jgi:hypothetical protein
MASSRLLLAGLATLALALPACKPKSPPPGGKITATIESQAGEKVPTFVPVAADPAMAKALADNQAKGNYTVLVLHRGAGANALATGLAPLAEASGKAACVTADVRDPGLTAIFKTIKLDPGTAPVPCALVVSPGGIVTGTFLNVPTPEKLAAALLPKQPLAVREALGKGKFVIVAMASATAPLPAESSKIIETFLADAKKKDKFVMLPIALDEAANAPFLADLKIDPGSKDSVCLVMEPPLKIVGKPLAGKFTMEQLVKESTPCCPPGGGG